MNPALWGGLSALFLGTADFMARFSSRAIGHVSALLGVLIVGCVITTGWIFLTQPLLNWSLQGAHWVLISGCATTVMTLLLYQGLARGPVSVVTSIVSAHPVLVVVLAVIVGARPSAFEWILMALTMIGVVIVARAANTTEPEKLDTPISELRTTIAISVGAMLAYAILVFAGQRAVPIYGELQTFWMARGISLVTLIAIMMATRHKPNLPATIWPFLIAQGLLDAGGYMALFAGSAGDRAEIAAVVASTFGVVTILLARVILAEQINVRQWTGIVLIFTCISALAY